jgi:hypothetical protein
VQACAHTNVYCQKACFRDRAETVQTAG